MKHLFYFKTFLIACIAMLLGGGSAVAQETETIDLTKLNELGFTRGQVINTYEGEGVTLSFGSGSSTPKYYVTEVRLYAGGKLTITSKSGTPITEILLDGSLDKPQNTLSANVGTIDDSEYIGLWTGNSEEVIITVGSTSGNAKIKTIKITFALEEGAVATPTISPATGTMFDESQKVTITPADAAHTVWYTTDGSEPTTAAPSIQYTAPFTIDATTTIKAIATDGTKVSSVASAEYTKVEAIDGLVALVAKIKEDNSSANAEYYVDLTDAVVTGVTSGNAYVEEAGTGIYISQSGHSLKVGQMYSGLATVSAKMNNELPLFTAFDCATVVEGAELPLTIVTLAELTANYETYLYRRVKVEDATVAAAFANKNGQITQEATSIDVYAQGGADIAMGVNDEIDMIAFPNMYSGNQQLNVLAQEDIIVKKVAPVFNFSIDAVSAYADRPFVAPDLVNTHEDKVVTYESSNTSVATVNASTGEVTFVAEGTTTITASLVGGQEASYTLSVIVKRAGCYYQITSADELEAGAYYLIAYKSKNVVMGAQSGSYRSSVETTIKDYMITTTPAETAVITLEGSAGAWNLKASDAYLYWDSGNSVKTGDKYDWTITIAEDGTAFIASKATPTRELQYNSGSPRFACYTGSQQDIQIYKLYNEISIGADGFSTFYTDKAFVMPQGVQGGIITAAEGDKLTIEYNYAAGATVPAGTALLLKGAAGEYAYDITTTEETAPANNLLHGADAVDGEGKTYVEGTSVKYYVLSKNTQGENLGFYWAEADGAAIAYQAGKAFLAVDGGAAAMFKLFDGNATGIDAVENGTIDNGAIYDLSGRKVLAPVKGGIYVKNGKKFIVK